MTFIKTIIGWFSGGGANKVAEVVDEAVYTRQEQAVDDSADLASARSYDPGTKFDTWVDRWHRAIRPAIATWAISVLFGILPPPDHWRYIPEPVWQLIVVIIGFYFGGRVILKDIPSMIRALRK